MAGKKYSGLFRMADGTYGSRIFFQFLSKIEDHPIFHNASFCEQEKVWIQLAVALIGCLKKASVKLKNRKIM
jgi:hypothetical protein